MSTGIFFLIEAIAYMLLLIIVYFNKKRLKNEENKIYIFLVIVAITELILELLLDFVGPLYSTITVISYFVAKLYCVFLQLWITVLCLYIMIITLNMNNQEKYKKTVRTIFMILLIIFSVLIFKLPISFYCDGKITYTYGSSVNIVYVSSMLFTIIGIICLIYNRKNIRDKRFLPLVLFIIIGGVGSFIQYENPGLLLAVPIHAFITFLMYFTIENPDMKLLKEMHEAKEISDNANEEKTLFLYNMTQEIRATTKNIDNEADIIIDSDDIDTDKESARNIKGETSKFRMMTNDILDVSAIDSSNIKIYNSSYNLKMLLRTIISSYTDICHNKNLEFRTNIDHSIPESLYGDNISLKKAINLLLTYSVKSTKKGYVELDINTIIKNDIVRLIITIEDSSMGIKSSELEKIKIDNKNISESYKLITLMNGTMVLTSNYGSGNKIKIILDQKIDKTPNKEEKKYQSILEDKKILIIDNSEPSIKIIEKLLKGSNINIDYSLNGRDAYNKIKTRNRYDLILLDEELNTISGYEMLKNLQGIRNFNIPVILLSKDNKYEYNEEYLKMGFSDILIKPLNKEILLEKINKNIINRVDILENNKEISK